MSNSWEVKQNRTVPRGVGVLCWISLKSIKMLFFEPMTFICFSLSLSIYLYIYIVQWCIYIYTLSLSSTIIIIIVYIYIHIINDRPSPRRVQLGKVFRAARIYLYPTKKVPVSSLIFVVVVDFVAVVLVVIGVVVIAVGWVAAFLPSFLTLLVRFT